MEVQFFYNTSDDRAINKTLVEGATFEGQAREDVDIMSPNIRFDTPEVIRYNYAYIPLFQRYYSVSNVNAFRENLFDVQFSVDVLMSFRGDIQNLVAVVDKQSEQSNGDEYIDDGSLVTDNMVFTRVTEYPGGFNDTAEYILIVAG